MDQQALMTSRRDKDACPQPRHPHRRKGRDERMPRSEALQRHESTHFLTGRTVRRRTLIGYLSVGNVDVPSVAPA